MTSYLGRKFLKALGKALKHGAKFSARIAAKAAITGAKTAMNKAPDFESLSQWMIRVVTNLPKYLRLYLYLLTDNRVDHKAKAALITAVAILGVHFGFGGILFKIQALLSVVLGPFAFLPTIITLLLTLDTCYTFIASDVLEQYEKKVFGEGHSVQADITRLKNYLGDIYEKVKETWRGKTDAQRKKMEEEGYIVDGELTDETIQETADAIIELETSEKLQAIIEREVKKLETSEAEGPKALKEFKEKLMAAGSNVTK